MITTICRLCPTRTLSPATVWLLAASALCGCAQLPPAGGIARQDRARPVVVEAPVSQPRSGSPRGGVPVATTLNRGQPFPPARRTSTSAEPASPTVPLESAPRGQSPGAASFPESPDGFWIVSSRQARGAPSIPDSSRQLGYLYRGPRGLVPASREAFLSTLRPDRPVCFVIHGSYNYWPDVIRESQRNHQWIQQAARGTPVQFVYFTWPSDGYAHVVFPVELAVMGRRSAVHSVYLANLISQFPAQQPVTLIGHSHGARAAAAALHALGGGAVDDGSTLPAGSPVPGRMRAVLVAAAIDHDWLNPGNKYGNALRPVERILVIHNHRDGWLSVYPLQNPFSGQQALGRSGINFGDRMQLNELGQKITLLDSSGFAGRSHDFSAVNSRPEMAEAIAPFVTFQDPAGPPIDSNPYRDPPPSDQFLPPRTTPASNKRGPSNVQAARQRSGASARPAASGAAVSQDSPPAKPRLSMPAARTPRAEFWVEPVESGP